MNAGVTGDGSGDPLREVPRRIATTFDLTPFQRFVSGVGLAIGVWSEWCLFPRQSETEHSNWETGSAFASQQILYLAPRGAALAVSSYARCHGLSASLLHRPVAARSPAGVKMSKRPD